MLYGNYIFLCTSIMYLTYVLKFIALPTYFYPELSCYSFTCALPTNFFSPSDVALLSLNFATHWCSVNKFMPDSPLLLAPYCTKSLTPFNAFHLPTHFWSTLPCFCWYLQFFHGTWTTLFNKYHVDFAWFWSLHDPSNLERVLLKSLFIYIWFWLCGDHEKTLVL